jgi:hypothetical protein
MTDDDGVVRAIVPRNKTYRIEILDEERELSYPPIQAYEEPAFLVCRFVDEDGAPVANAKIEARADGDKFEFVTDEDGRIHSATPLGTYELRIEDQVFQAHALLLRDLEEDGSHYRFVLSTATDHEADDPLWRYDTPPDVENQEAAA